VSAARRRHTPAAAQLCASFNNSNSHENSVPKHAIYDGNLAAPSISSLEHELMTSSMHQAMEHARLRNGRHRRPKVPMLLVLVIAALAAVVFLWRGPYRGMSNPSDFVLIYSPARAWLTGANPYDMEQVDRAWLDAGGPLGHAPTRRTAPNLLYPPSTLLTLAPFSALRWPAAHYAWLLGNVAFLAVSMVCVARLAGFTLSQRRTWVFASLGLVLAPVHTTLHHGQTPLYVMALMMPAFVLAWRAGGGTLLGMSAAIKPQIGLPVLALEIVRARWRSVFAGIVTLAIILVVSIVPMSMRGIPWLSAWRANLDAHATTGAGDLSAANPDRHQMVNLQYPITALVESKAAAEIGTLVLCAMIAAAFFLPLKTRASRAPLLLALSMVAVLTLMVTYHRFYDAVLLLIPLGWCVARIADRQRPGAAWCVLALMLPYFLNSATAVRWLQKTDRLPARLVDTWWWEHVFMPHQGWALLAMSLCLLVAGRTVHHDVAVNNVPRG
jgi:hypothetical protein